MQVCDSQIRLHIYFAETTNQESRILIRQCFQALSFGRCLSLVPVTFGLLLGLAAASHGVFAQSPATDSMVHRLTPVEISADAEKKRGVFRRMSDRSKVTYLQRENRSLERKLAHLDGVMLRLEARLDSLKSARELREHGIATLDSTVAAMRAHRARLEASVRVRELIAWGQGPTKY